MILDTDVLSLLCAPHCPPRLLGRLMQAQYPLCTTAVSWSEICYGIARLPAGDGAYLRSRYEEIVIPYVEILAFTADCAEVYGRIRSELERQGRPLADADLMIASTAVHHDMTLITGNTRHFARVPGLRLENWLEEDDGPRG